MIKCRLLTGTEELTEDEEVVWIGIKWTVIALSIILMICFVAFLVAK